LNAQTVLAKIRLLIQILKTRMHPASQTQHELVFKNQPPLPGEVAKRELLGIWYRAFWELPNLLQCGRLRRRTFKSFLNIKNRQYGI